MRRRSMLLAIACALGLFLLPHAGAFQQTPSPPPVSQSTSIAPVPRISSIAPGQAAPASAFQQFTLIGVVLDGKGKPVKDAEVTLVDPDTNFKAAPLKTDKKGGFTFSNLTTSTYRLQAKKGDHQSDTADVAIGTEKTTRKTLVLK